MNIHPGP